MVYEYEMKLHLVVLKKFRGLNVYPFQVLPCNHQRPQQFSR